MEISTLSQYSMSLSEELVGLWQVLDHIDACYEIHALASDRQLERRACYGCGGGVCETSANYRWIEVEPYYRKAVSGESGK